jgi:hypothetical protein
MNEIHWIFEKRHRRMIRDLALCCGLQDETAPMSLKYDEEYGSSGEFLDDAESSPQNA